MLNNFDPGQARHFVGPDLGPDCLQRITSKQRVKCINHVKMYRTYMLSAQIAHLNSHGRIQPSITVSDEVRMH